MKKKAIVLFGLIWFAVTGISTSTAWALDLPLKVSGNGRYLTERNGTPFLYHADTGWGLFYLLTAEEAELYLENRREKKFSVIQVVLLPFEPNEANRAGENPFRTQSDFSTPNEAYFAHVERVLELAREKGLILSINPAWHGCCNTNWMDALGANGPEGCRALGRYLGKRFGSHDNLLWILGGDRDAEELVEEHRALAEGLKETAPHQLHTYHASSSHSSTDIYPNEPWLDFSMIYTYFRGKTGAWVKPEAFLEVYEEGYDEYGRTPVKPFILGESQYEGENVGVDWMVRRQAYWALLSGGCGHSIGTRNWRFPADWKDHLNLPGVEDMRHFHDLFAPREWWKLVPDPKGRFVKSGGGTFGAADWITAASTPDGGLFLAYVPPTGNAPRTLAVDWTLSGTSIKARWFNPADGSWVDGTTSAPDETGVRTFTTPGNNGSGQNDWVLVGER